MLRLFLTTLTKRMTRQRSCIGIIVVLLAVGFTMPLPAQMAFPDVPLSGLTASANASTPVDHDTPTRGHFRIDRFRAELMQDYTPFDSIPTDSIERRMMQYARPQLGWFSNVNGLQLLPYSMIAFAADRDVLARTDIKTWLATPTLSLDDRISTLLDVVRATADPAHPARLADAERALTDLQRLPREFLVLQIEAHDRLARAYYELGMRDSVLSHGARALAVAGRLPYLQRLQILADGDHFPRQQTVFALASLSDGPARITQYLDRTLAMSAFTPAVAATLSESDQAAARRYAASVAYKVAALRQIGQPAAPIQAHAWLNLDSASAQRQDQPRVHSMADGVVHVLEFGDIGCGPCKEALPTLQRLRVVYKARGVEFLYLDQTRGNWGVNLVTPSEEVVKLKEFYLHRLQVVMPIAIWAGDKVPSGNEGEMRPTTCPNRKAYGVSGTPLFVVVDGVGRIRFLRSGFEAEGKLLERELGRVLNFVLADTRANPAVPPSVLDRAPSPAVVH